MSTHDHLSQVFEVILEEVRTRPGFSERLAQALNADQAQEPSKPEPRPRARNRRSQPVLDPMQLYAAGENCLRAGLANLSIEQLKDIIAEYGMDTRRLAMRWKQRARLEELIMTTVGERHAKGSAFRKDAPGN